jgi:Ser/Thr protein kinase RdoA (MazF antagonist)
MLPGETVGSRKPWPHWVYDDTTLDQVGDWLRDFHRAVVDFSPAPSSAWRSGGSWSPGLVIGHNDAAPYNAAWQDGRLQGFFDWDFAGPVTPEFDLAFCCVAWVPLHARQVAEAEGFRDFARRPHRLRRLLAAYGWEGAVEDLRRVMVEVVVRHISDVEALAADGDPAFQRLVQDGVLDSLQLALSEVESVEL